MSQSIDQTKRTPSWDLAKVNESLEVASPQSIVYWALAQQVSTIASTSFGPQSAATLHLVAVAAPEVPVVFVDTGFNTAATMEFSRQVTNQLGLRLEVVRPRLSPIELLRQFGVQHPADLDDESRSLFADIAKIEPFDRAIQVLAPRIWITGIRASETEYRANLPVASWDPRGILKIAPFMRATDAEISNYFSRHQLPLGPNNVDPTKQAPHLECGLHTRILQSRLS